MKLVHKLFMAAAWLVQRLPDRLLYALSDVLYFKLYWIFRYRKRIVTDNLTRCFPEISTDKISSIRKAYYRNLVDIILEVMKTPGLTAEEIKNKYHIKNPEVINALREKNRSTVMLTGHLGNWEWFGSGLLLNFSGLDAFAVVKPLSDPFFDKYLNDIRALYKPDFMIPFKQTLKYMIKNKDKTTFTLFAADQTPHRSEIQYVTKFLNQPTPLFTGFEKLAKKLDQAVIFIDMYRVRRGYYEATFYPITEHPLAYTQNEITLEYVHLLEEAILRNPDNWLWSHRRWKYMNDSNKTAG